MKDLCSLRQVNTKYIPAKRVFLSNCLVVLRGCGSIYSTPLKGLLCNSTNLYNSFKRPQVEDL
ncbi:hypothetical protein NQ317_005663 [Molorchus minor]|uniref:Uncharacterized protein n=1 Tax=Molorchus minor TaxID=1323400 RepID=A0ABQ9K7T5_9CUCU|nr:hypothetical protein NQ317_005663 [Molorchus minor]